MADSEQAGRSLEQQVQVPSGLRDYVFIDEPNRTVYVREEGKTAAGMRSVKARAGNAGARYTVVNAERFRELEEAHARQSTTLSDSKVQEEARTVFHDAAAKRATDIHLYIRSSHAELLYRIDGQLLPQGRWMRQFADRWVSAVYGTLATEKDTQVKLAVAQSGAIRDRPEVLPESVHAVRIERNASDDGHYMVMRLLYDSSDAFSGTVEQRMSQLGYHDRQVELFSIMRQIPSGVVLLAGKVNSGKSTTLQQWLAADKEEHPEKAFFTIEDPPEYPIPDVVQIPVKPEAYQQGDMTEGQARKTAYLRSMASAVRSDMNTVMVGELRDAETSSFALDAARAGYQVYTSVHANSAFGTIERLAELLSQDGGGSETALQAALLRVANPALITGVIYQHLVPTMCPHCKLNYREHAAEQLPRDIRQQITHSKVDTEKLEDGAFIRNPEGCEHCAEGIKGRTVVAEVLLPDEKIMTTIRNQSISDGMSLWREQGGLSVHDHALEKITQGLIDPRDARKAVGPLSYGEVTSDGHIEAGEMESLGVEPRDSAEDGFDDSPREANTRG